MNLRYLGGVIPVLPGVSRASSGSGAPSDVTCDADVSPMLQVLPERVPGQKLRLTTNGNILQQGGTISGRRITAAHSFNPLTEEQQLRSVPTSPAPAVSNTPHSSPPRKTDASRNE